MRLVKRAILEQGCIGVKLYPPMGFAPWGNASLNIWRGKKGLPPAAADPTFGRQLDEAMERLFIWCLEEDVPVMAHTNRSNAPFEDFRALAGAEYWERALQRFKGLRVNFGHFGDTDLEDHEGKVSDGFVRLMSRNSAAAGSRAFADSSYFAGVLTQAPAVTKTLLNLYAKSDQDVLVERLMYGSDWTMILPQKRVDQYLAEFIEVMTQIQHELRPRPPVSGSLTDAFFGRNATAYLGLAKGAKARGRLESFYARRRVATPDWMRKVG
jgi:predicted TIM-barrel fold metal-dependent hydrolase